MYLSNGNLHKYTQEQIDAVRNGQSAEDLGITKRAYQYIKSYYITKTIKNKGNKATGKTGRHSWHSKPIGSERFDKDGYILVKIAYPRVERRKHYIEWEKYNPPIDTRKECLLFLDGDKTNCNIENLYKTKRALLAPLNQLVKKYETKEQKLVAIKAVELYCEALDKQRRETMKGKHSKARCEHKPIHQMICQMYDEGYNNAEICEKLGVKKGVIKYAKKRRRLQEGII